MSVITDQITTMQNQTAFNQTEVGRTTSSDTSDSNMFLTLMLQQLQNQDPTQPTDNTEWLAQLAQYSTLEQMTQMNQGFEDCMSYLSALYSDIAANAEITQTLSMIGKEVTIKIPAEKEGEKDTIITGKVEEASFEEGTGQVKVNGEYYSIANIVSIREESSSDTISDSASGTEANTKSRSSNTARSAA